MISTKTKSDFIVRLADKSDTLSIRNIWRECFTNDSTYIDNFLNNCFPHSKSWIALPKNSIDAVAVLSLLPSYFTSNGHCFSGGYIYGVATLPNYRGNSLSKILMNAAFEHSSASNLNYLVVKPADEGLYNFYRGQSFDILINKHAFHIDLHSYNLDTVHFSEFNSFHSLKSFKNTPEYDIITQKLFSLRENEKSDIYLLWPYSILQYALMDIMSKGGDLHFTYDRKDNLVLYYIEHPVESDSGIIKVIDCNYKSERDLSLIISHIKSTQEKVKKIVFEGNFNNSPLPSFCITKEKSALIKFLDDKINPEFISNIHLSLPME